MLRPNASFSTARRMNQFPDSADVSVSGNVSIKGKGDYFSKGRPCALEGNMGGRSGSPVSLNKGMLLAASACLLAVSCTNFRTIGPDDAGPDSDTEVDSETGPGKGSSANGTGQDSSRDTGTGPDAGTGSGMRPDSGAGPDSDTEQDSDSLMDSDADPDSGTGSETDTGPDSDTEQDSDTEPGDSDSATATDEGDTGGDTGTESPFCKLYSQVASIDEPGFAQEEISADEGVVPGYTHPEDTGEPFAVRYEFPQGVGRQDVEGKRLGLAFDGAEDWSFVSLDAESGKISFGKGAAKNPAEEPGTLDLSVPVSFGLEDGSVASVTISSIQNAQKVLVSIGHSSGDSLPALNAIAGNPIPVSLGGKEYVFVLHGADPFASTAEVSLFERFERVSSGETLSDGSLVLLSFGENGLQVILATSPSCE